MPRSLSGKRRLYESLLQPVVVVKWITHSVSGSVEAWAEAHVERRCNTTLNLFFSSLEKGHLQVGSYTGRLLLIRKQK